ncbi:synaptic vesicle glycoprotein 2B-like isoform X3 [Rhynchophorus ferrugineus]|uniref:synaptic vesicle glycoprotein 2B-like isoform X3 n=1 Tax=Rhynchophorus ferrugineus TaxID=354439 RepID=UPI003FCEA4FA
MADTSSNLNQPSKCHEGEVTQNEIIQENRPSDYETAICATKFGKFNILLVAVALISTLSVQSETAVMSYIIPMAVCDLNLTSNQKGLLNSMAFLGMVLSGFFWGFLVDTLGRRKMLFIGFVAETVVTVGKALTTRIGLLYFYQFCGGALVGGLYVAMNTYLHELHSTSRRGYIQMMYGATFSVANILVPVMCASTILFNIYFKNIMGYFSWNMLLLISALPSVLSAISLFFLPETPKFLMSTGKNQEALRVFQQIYKMNTNNPKEKYGITSLIDEISGNEDEEIVHKSWKEYIISGWSHIKPLFSKEHRLNLLLVSVVHSIIQFVLNALRLYLPQVFQAAHDYEIANNKTSDICDALTWLRSTDIVEEEIVCSSDLINNFDVYLNSMIVSIVLLIAYILAGSVINTFGKRNLFAILNVAGSASVACLYFSPNTTTIVVLNSSFFICIGLCFDLLVIIIMVLFPTALRAMAYSITLSLGRVLTIAGNLIIPWLVSFGCLPLFLTFGSLTFGSLLLSCLIPNTDKMDIK